jgi:hypothetical protein
MTTERRGLFVFRTDDTGTKCSPDCPQHDYVFTSRDNFAKPAWSTCEWNDPHRQQAEGAAIDVRHARCIAAERALHDALSAENASARGIRGIYEGS